MSSLWPFLNSHTYQANENIRTHPVHLSTISALQELGMIVEQGFSAQALVTLWIREFCVVGAAPGTVRCLLLASLAPTHEMPGAPTPQLWQRQIPLNIATCSLEGKITPDWKSLFKALCIKN